jgi:F-box/leucine-rich repeat protein 2/20
MAGSVCINEILTDDELRAILGRLGREKDKEAFGLVCKKWLYLQSTERKRLAARAGPHMLRRMAARFSRAVELDLSQSASRSFYPGVTDSDLCVIADGFRCLRVLYLQDCKGKLSVRFRVFFFLAY